MNNKIPRIMSEEIIPDKKSLKSDVVESIDEVTTNQVEETATVETTPQETVEVAPLEAVEKSTGEPLEVKNSEKVEQTVEKEVEEPVNYSEMTLAELIKTLVELIQDEDKTNLFNEAEAIKSAFYKRLNKEKAEAKLVEAVPLDELEESKSKETSYVQIEAIFKEHFNTYKKERVHYNKQLEKEREENYVLKVAVLNDLKALLEKEEEINVTFPEFREIQNRWKAIGPVPAHRFRDLNQTYQVHVENFYDKVTIHRELRDLDFKKNLETKENLCIQAEALANHPNIVEAFKLLQKLHDEWKEYGPVAKEYRESIWERFREATAVINKKYQAHFEERKQQYVKNLEAKTKLCEKVEEITEKEIQTSNEWNALSKDIEEIQAEWRTIGYATKKENQRIYDRFRAACDKFYDRKREFYAEYKENINENLEKKIALCEEAESLKSSTDWKKTTDQFINLQKQWKAIGPVPRKRSDQLWKRFRAACDEFFTERDKHVKPENDYYGNLKAKRHLIEEINAYVLTNDAADQAAMQNFVNRWHEIGFVPYKEKDNIANAYKEALKNKFPKGNYRRRRSRRPLTEKELLIQKYNQLEQDIITYENNIGFFADSKKSQAMVKQMEERIAKAKTNLAALAEQIRNVEEKE